MEHVVDHHKGHLNQPEKNERLQWKESPWSETYNRGNAITEQITGPELDWESIMQGKIENRSLKDIQSVIWAGKLTVWVRSFEI